MEPEEQLQQWLYGNNISAAAGNQTQRIRLHQLRSRKLTIVPTQVQRMDGTTISFTIPEGWQHDELLPEFGYEAAFLYGNISSRPN